MKNNKQQKILSIISFEPIEVNLSHVLGNTIDQLQHASSNGKLISDQLQSFTVCSIKTVSKIVELSSIVIQPCHVSLEKTDYKSLVKEGEKLARYISNTQRKLPSRIDKSKAKREELEVRLQKVQKMDDECVRRRRKIVKDMEELLFTVEPVKSLRYVSYVKLSYLSLGR